MTLTCPWWSTEWGGPSHRCLLFPLCPLHPLPPSCQLAVWSIRSNHFPTLSPWQHSIHGAYRPQVESLMWSEVKSDKLILYLLNVWDKFHTLIQGNKAENCFYCFCFPCSNVFLALCAPLEMSPSSLQFQVEPLAPQSDAYTKVMYICYFSFSGIAPSPLSSIISFIFPALLCGFLQYLSLALNHFPFIFTAYPWGRCYCRVCIIILNICHNTKRKESHCFVFWLAISLSPVLSPSLCLSRQWSWKQCLKRLCAGTASQVSMSTGGLTAVQYQHRQGAEERGGSVQCLHHSAVWGPTNPSP